MSKIQKLLSVAEAMTVLAESIKDLASTMSETAPTEPVKKAPKEKQKPDAKPITMEEVRAVLAEKSRNGQAEGVRELLQKYGCSKLSDINPDDYEALMADAEVLGNAE